MWAASSKVTKERSKNQIHARFTCCRRCISGDLFISVNILVWLQDMEMLESRYIIIIIIIILLQHVKMMIIMIIWRTANTKRHRCLSFQHKAAQMGGFEGVSLTRTVVADCQEQQVCGGSIEWKKAPW